MSSDIFDSVKKDMDEKNPTVEVGGVRYSITPLGAFEALEIFKQISTSVGTPLMGLVQKMKSGMDVPLEDTVSWIEVVAILCREVKELNTTDLSKLLLKGLKANGIEVDPNDHFKGKLGAMTRVIAFAFKENFSELFTEWLKETGLTIPTFGQLKDMFKEQVEKEEQLQEASNESLNEENQE